MEDELIKKKFIAYLLDTSEKICEKKLISIYIIYNKSDVDLQGSELTTGIN